MKSPVPSSSSPSSSSDNHLKEVHHHQEVHHHHYYYHHYYYLRPIIMMILLENKKPRRSKAGILRTVLLIVLLIHMIRLTPFTFDYDNYGNTIMFYDDDGDKDDTATTSMMINNKSPQPQHTTTYDDDDDDDNDDEFSFINYNVTGTTDLNTNATRILNISTYDDLLSVLDLYDQPHYCGYYKCYYSTKTKRSSNNNNNKRSTRKNNNNQNNQNNENIGLFITQGENWIPERNLQHLQNNLNNRTYYDVLYDSWKFSKQVVKEFGPGKIRSLLAGPPIQLTDKPTNKHLRKLNYHIKNEYSWLQYGDYFTQRIYDESTSLIIQEVYKLPGTLYETIFEIRMGSGPKIINDIMDRIIQEATNNTMLIQNKLRAFIDTFTNDINIVKSVITKYPIFGEDFQFLIDLDGKVYQTDWDRIFFVYNWSYWNYDNITQKNNHTKIVEYVIPYIDEMINISNEIYYNVTNNIKSNNNTITNNNINKQ